MGGFAGILGVIAPVVSGYFESDLRAEQAQANARIQASANLANAQIASAESGQRRFELIIVGGLVLAGITVVMLNRG